jgi:hypothetical protein
MEGGVSSCLSAYPPSCEATLEGGVLLRSSPTLTEGKEKQARVLLAELGNNKGGYSACWS